MTPWPRAQFLRGLTGERWTVDAMTMHPPVSDYVRDLGIVRDVVQLPDPADGRRHAPPGSARCDRAATTAASCRFRRRAGNTRRIGRGVGSARLSHARLRRPGRHHRAKRRATCSCRCAAAIASPRTCGWPGRWGCRPIPTICATGFRRAGARGRVARDAGNPSGLDGLEGKRVQALAVRHVSRRWPASQAESGRSVRFFLGPHEVEEAARVEQDFRGVEGISIVRQPLAEAARRLAECEVFVGNDAGFSHLASGLGVKTLALYGMTSEVRGAPIGPAIAFRPSLCPACHDEGSSGFDCVRRLEYRCILRDVEFDAVKGQVDRLFASSPKELQLSLEGPFRLYGKAR